MEIVVVAVFLLLALAVASNTDTPKELPPTLFDIRPVAIPPTSNLSGIIVLVLLMVALVAIFM